jgi:hypothetical protein
MATLDLFHIETHGRDRATQHLESALGNFTTRSNRNHRIGIAEHKDGVVNGKRLLKGEFAAL